jgi:hypothetical protein
MPRRQRETFLNALVSDMMAESSGWTISDHLKIEWSGQPRNLWPEADIVIDTGGRRFIVEYDEDSDPGRSIIKYWPIIERSKGSLTIIEVWKRGSTIGEGYAELAMWVAAKLETLYPTFHYCFVERTDETSRSIAGTLIHVIGDYLHVENQ